MEHEKPKCPQCGNNWSWQHRGCVEELRAINGELLAALKRFVHGELVAEHFEHTEGPDTNCRYLLARRAIEKAQGR